MERARALLSPGRQRPPEGRALPADVRSVCRDRASKRWSALLTQSKSRIGHKCGMRKRLGEAHWAAFVRYAEAEHKAAFFAAFCGDAPGGGDNDMYRKQRNKVTQTDKELRFESVLLPLYLFV